MYIDKQRINFSTFGPYSPWADGLAHVNSMTQPATRSGDWAVDLGGEADQSSLATRLHSFHPYQTAATDCTAPSCLYGILLADGDNSVLSFLLPPTNQTGYIPLTIDFLPVPVGATAPVPPLSNWTGSDWLYFTVVPCPVGWLTDNTCVECPGGGYCPGGGRVWPLPGHWSFDETSAPVPCALPASCVGALVTQALSVSGSRDTQLCAEGYVSHLLTQTAVAHIPNSCDRSRIHIAVCVCVWNRPAPTARPALPTTTSQGNGACHVVWSRLRRPS